MIFQVLNINFVFGGVYLDVFYFKESQMVLMVDLIFV